MHKRTWELGENYMRLNDQVTGKGNKKIEINFHIHPSISIESLDKNTFTLRVPSGETCFFGCMSQIDVRIEKSTFHPGFNKTVNSHLLQLSCEVDLPASFDFLLHWDN